MKPRQLYDSVQTSWDTCRVLDCYDKLDDILMGLITDLSKQEIMQESISAKYDKALLSHHNWTGLFEWPEYDATHAVSENHCLSMAEDEYPCEVLQEDAVCSLPLSIVPYGLRRPADHLSRVPQET